jgi:hypothetical protein
MEESLPVPVAVAKNFYGGVFKKEPEIGARILRTYRKGYNDFYRVCGSDDFREVDDVAHSIEKAIPVMPRHMPEEKDLAIKHFQLKSMLKNMKGDGIGKPTEKEIAELGESYNRKYRADIPEY